MRSAAWLNKNDQFAPGKELFRSKRRFSVWAYALSHSQLLLRARTTTDDGRRQPRIDILFKPVDAMKTRMDYDGLVLRCATTEERERILGQTNRTADNQVFIIESGETVDYVVARAVGWQEDDQQDREPSALAFFVPATDPTRLLPSDSPTSWSAVQAAQIPD
ncbi:hypothetical protein ONA91_29685 [Micromonospora sp. DR5-3]|uniref:hypothetical protein n=1 Tax=unclassified Micromonospora TaxID=2617518 RepID=UPI0011DC16BE|nr:MULTISPECIES: hypothetical protein [unclassified Micromonospora]MCW3818618.1 hypothetical protein [Micromonospora sp. DR5-3]TYC16367.1 hypothetical protein FXF52_39365 [Micromonospora sp. MP36]